MVSNLTALLKRSAARRSSTGGGKIGATTIWRDPSRKTLMHAIAAIATPMLSAMKAAYLTDDRMSLAWRRTILCGQHSKLPSAEDNQAGISASAAAHSRAASRRNSVF